MPCLCARFAALLLPITLAAIGCGRQVEVEASSALPALTPLQLAVKRAYTREFGISVFRPAIFDAICGDQGYVTSSAYVRTPAGKVRLLYITLSSNGSTVLKAVELPNVVAPVGSFRVLVALAKHSSTVTDDTMARWEEAQRAINQEHEAFAVEHGYREPIVAFENTNLLVDPLVVRDLKSKQAILEATAPLRIGTPPFTFVVSINLDPAQSEGGYAIRSEGFVYVGNFNSWREPLSLPHWRSVARTVYHHEIGHLWGWPPTHDWARHCEDRRLWPGPFVVPPTLFGWEDADGDGIPEVLDETPYGRASDASEPVR